MFDVKCEKNAAENADFCVEGFLISICLRLFAFMVRDYEIYGLEENESVRLSIVIFTLTSNRSYQLISRDVSLFVCR